MIRKLINALGLVVIIAAAVVAARELIAQREPLQAKPRPDLGPLVEVHQVQTRGADIVLTTQGSVRAKTRFQLTSDVAGRVTWIAEDFLLGNILDAGTVVARIDATPYKLAAAQANLAVREAELALADAHSRFKTKNPRHPQIRRAEAQLEAARAQREKARSDLARTEIALPQRGVVTRKSVALGQYVSPGTPLADLDATDWVEVPLPLSLLELDLLRSAEQVSITLSALGERSSIEWPATLGRIQQQLDSTTRVAYAIAEVKDPYQSRFHPLRIGQFVNARIEGISLSAAYRLPTTAIFDNRYVYRLSEQQTLERVAVEVIRQDERSAVVSADLEPGDELVLSRLDIMTDGMRVRVRGRSGASGSSVSSVQTPGAAS